MIRIDHWPSPTTVRLLYAQAVCELGFSSHVCLLGVAMTRPEQWSCLLLSHTSASICFGIGDRHAPEQLEAYARDSGNEQLLSQSQSSSFSSSYFAAILVLCFRSSSSSFVAFGLAKTPARINLASSSLTVKLSGVRPSPSKPTMRSAPTPSMNEITHGRT